MQYRVGFLKLVHFMFLYPLVFLFTSGKSLLRFNTVIHSYIRYSIMNTETSGHAQLTIRMVFPEDLGEYTCTARNEAGEAITIGHIIPEGNFYKLRVRASTQHANILVYDM